MSEQSLIPDAARTMIGKEWEEVVGQVTERDIRRFACAIDDPNPLYCDTDYARGTEHGSLIAPPLFHFTLGYTGELPISSLRVDGLPAVDTLLPRLNTSGTMFGGSALEFFRPMRPGDVVTVRRKVADIYERRSSGGGLAFIIMESTYVNQDGEPLLKERATYIGRE